TPIDERPRPSQHWRGQSKVGGFTARGQTIRPARIDQTNSGWFSQGSSPERCKFAIRRVFKYVTAALMASMTTTSAKLIKASFMNSPWWKSALSLFLPFLYQGGGKKMSHDAAKGMTTYVSQPGIQQTHLDALNRESPLNRQQSDLWPCPISPDTSDGMMMPGEKDDDTQQKNFH